MNPDCVGMDLDKMKEFIKWLEMFPFSRMILLHGTRTVERVTYEVKVLAYKYLLFVVCI
jgi:hypothetical protein